MIDDQLVLSEFKKALRRYAEETVVDLDDKFSLKFDFEIYRWEDIMRVTGSTIPPNKWSYYRIGLFKEGSGDFITGAYKFTALKNTLVAVPARMITSSKNWAPDTTGYVVLFNMDFFLQHKFPHTYIESKKILNSCLQPYIRLTDAQAEEVAAIFETILEERQVNNNFKEELIALKIIELLIVSDRLFNEQLHFETNLPTIDIIKKFNDLLEKNCLQEHSVRFYAEQLAVHPNYLNSLIKRHMGLTTKETIQNRLLLESKYLLHSTNLTIKEISNQVGFSDPNYFTSFFTRFENMSPGNYRSTFV